MNRRDFLAGTLGSAAVLGAADSPRPNIVFLLPDQLRAQALGCMGNKDAITPNFDRLASQGILLKNTFANTPVCCPARAILLTGKYASENGMTANDLRLRETEVTVPELLAKAGYRTGFIGKWHLDGGKRLPGFIPPGPRRQGFEFWAANQCSHAHFNTQYFRDDPTPIPMKKFEAEGWTDLALEFLDATKSDRRPFFLTVQMGPPHDPYKAPAENRAKFDAEKFELRPNYQDGPRSPGRAGLAEYYGMLNAVDDQVGRLMAKLDQLGLTENTIFIVSSDHGDMLGSHGQRLKRKPWEESIRVPGIIRWPAEIKPGQTSDLLFSHINFAPTVLSWCGVKPPVTMQGQDLSKTITTGKGPRPDSVFMQIFGPYKGDDTERGWRGVRTSRYTYARFEDKPWVLFDNEKDPYQLNNLVDDKALVAPLDRKLTRHMKTSQDSWSKNWVHLVEDGGLLYTGDTYYSVNEYLEAAAKKGVTVPRI